MSFSAVDPADEGEYTCKALNTHGRTPCGSPCSCKSNPSVVGTQPQVQVSPQNIEAHEGDNVRLYCRATGSPTPKLTWLKNGGQIPPQAIPSLGFHQFKSNSLDVLQRRIEELQSRLDRTDIGTLLIPNIQRSDSGTYMCVGSNSVGSNSSPLKVSVLKEQQTTSPQRSASSPPSLTFRKVRVWISAASPRKPPPSGDLEQGQRRLSSNHQVLGSQLRILSASPEDSGEYVCRVQGHSGNSNFQQASVSVSPVSDHRHRASQRGSESRSLVQLQVQNNVEVSADGSVMTVSEARPLNHGAYRCVASNPFGITQTIVSLIGSGEPLPSVSWHRLDRNRKTLLSSPVPMEGNAVMQILAARPEDSGTYVCSARSNEGSSETRVEVLVEGVPPPTISWSKLRSPLPWRHSVTGGSLVLPSVGRQDSGEYICSATNSLGRASAGGGGDPTAVPCSWDPPLTYTWSKLDGELPPRAQLSGGDLQINLATAEDAGSYKCVASNKVADSEVIAKVTVRSPLAVKVSPQVEVKAQGSAVEFTCSAAGGLETKVEWLKEGGALPPNHHIKDGVLRIENLEQSNEGVYICRASSAYGQAQDTARLTIQALPKVMINVRTSVQTVMIGNSVEFECQAVGDPEPTVKWSKVGGSLPSHIMVKEGMLRIDQVTEADAGQYRCTATNDVGSVQSQVVLNVQSLPQIASLPETKEVTVGSDAVLPCVASGYPLPEIRWSKVEGELPPKCFQDVNVLTVPRVTQEDSGRTCAPPPTSRGRWRPSLRCRSMNAYRAFSIRISFRPDNGDGMILYNGQKRSTGADFISLGLVGGRLEFRDPLPVKLGEFHTVELQRNNTLGSIRVDGGEPISGKSQGKFQGLDLNEDLHVGGYPNYTASPRPPASRAASWGDEVIFKDLGRSSIGDSEASLYQCSCPRGFTGSNCQHHSSLHCHAEACGPDATCINRQNGLGYDCRCHLGKSGDKCMQGELVTTPLFDGEASYIAYPPLSIVHDDLKVELEFKPLHANGLMFFCGGRKMKVEDFVSVSMVDGHVEFRYELGTGQAVLLSSAPVSLGQWHRVVAERIRGGGPAGGPGAPGEEDVSGESPGCRSTTRSWTCPTASQRAGVSSCVDGSPCDRRPCLNAGTCMSSAEYEFQCLSAGRVSEGQ
ncbi:hypothetical protein F7725_001426 [Dissostichus mawsoni]|uniref:Basement membrane-specific heparan sulfate proteoglycan core protein n=1 Tax=Dissostichus mawsoni TaxID=36200 RepID=A0A7J5ZJD3_DISMA|nr:hypothetical protein F7725_001426 [Dissostichus mawsoni]